ncbi:MAG: hypothetical protein FD180_282 [Planctomycetota bacterium]|nr:MAG: hypothetical protein FD180_282 [Planctomycetota bacterium]
MATSRPPIDGKWTVLSLLAGLGGTVISVGAPYWLPISVPPWEENARCFGSPVFLFLFPAYSTCGYAFIVGILLAGVAVLRGETADTPSRRRQWWIALVVNALPLAFILTYMVLAAHFHPPI